MVDSVGGNKGLWCRYVFSLLLNCSVPLPSSHPRTVVAGYGEVPHDSLSMLVVITIILGLGIPVVVVLVGGGYVVYRRRPWQSVVRWVTETRARRGYTTIN